MKNAAVFLTVLLISSSTAFAATSTDTLSDYLRDSLHLTTQRVKKKIGHSRYMEEQKLEVKTDIPGWEGVPAALYQYHVYDRETKTRKTAKVYLCDASDEQLARWIISACWQAKHQITHALIDKLLTRIIGQSNAQFPVLGIVYEDMNDAGINTPYVFKDGVTVYPKNFKPSTGQLTDTLIEACVHLTNKQITNNTGTYARICSTTREDYILAGGKQQVGSSSKGQKKILWLAVVRDLYKQALTSDNNELITAWAKSHL